MKVIIDIPEYVYERIREYYEKNDTVENTYGYIYHGTPIPDNAINGDVIKAMFGDDKVSEFMGYVRIMAKVGNWFNEGVVAEFNRDWWDEPYQKGDKE